MKKETNKISAKYLRYDALALLAFSLFLLVCCKKDETRIYKVSYEVVMVPNIKTEIQYNSDLYFATKEMKTITFNSDSSNKYASHYWTATRYAQKEEGYFIKVNYTNNGNVNDSLFAVTVYVNDTLYIQSQYSKDVFLQGQFNN